MTTDLTIQGYNVPSAIAERRRIAEMPEICDALSQVDRNILQTSAKQQIKDLPTEEVAEKLKKMLPYIAIDVGYKIPDNKQEWQYMCVRLYDVISKYYSQLTLGEIRLAFELAMVGELNDYLPRDQNKQPDAKHYQHFNADYFGKILNAYIARQRLAISRAHKAEPKRIELTHDNGYFKHRIKEVFYEYKYRGKIGNYNGFFLQFVYEWLCQQGYADASEPTAQDRHKAFLEYRKQVTQKLINENRAVTVMRKGENAEEIDYPARCIARDREIAKAFERMQKEEIQIYKYI